MQKITDHFVVLMLTLSLFLSCGERDHATPAGFFVEAVPVWPEGLQYEKNITTGFYARFEFEVAIQNDPELSVEKVDGM